MSGVFVVVAVWIPPQTHPPVSSITPDVAGAVGRVRGHGVGRRSDSHFPHPPGAPTRPTSDMQGSRTAARHRIRRHYKCRVWRGAYWLVASVAATQHITHTHSGPFADISVDRERYQLDWITHVHWLSWPMAGNVTKLNSRTNHRMSYRRYVRCRW